MKKFSLALLLVGSAYMDAAQLLPSLSFPNISVGDLDSTIQASLAMEKSLLEEHNRLQKHWVRLLFWADSHLLKLRESNELLDRLPLIRNEIAKIAKERSDYIAKTYGSAKNSAKPDTTVK